MKKNEFTQEYLKECFEYDSNTGDLVWKTRPQKHFKNEVRQRVWNTNYSGKIAGYTDTKRGYKYIRLDDKLFGAHQFVYALFNDSVPKIIDHIDRNGLNNKIENLREATNQQNLVNHTVQKNNKCGYKGVSIDTNSGNWVAVIHPNRKKRFIGSFSSKEEAAAAYNIAARAYFGEYAWQNEVDFKEEDVTKISKFFRVYLPQVLGGEDIVKKNRIQSL